MYIEEKAKSMSYTQKLKETMGNRPPALLSPK